MDLYFRYIFYGLLESTFLWRYDAICFFSKKTCWRNSSKYGEGKHCTHTVSVMWPENLKLVVLGSLFHCLNRGVIFSHSCMRIITNIKRTPNMYCKLVGLALSQALNNINPPQQLLLLVFRWVSSVFLTKECFNTGIRGFAHKLLFQGSASNTTHKQQGVAHFCPRF